MVSTIDLYKVGLLETMCFCGLNANYWYMKDDYLYHNDRMTQTLHRRRLNQIMGTYSATWEDVNE